MLVDCRGGKIADLNISRDVVLVEVCLNAPNAEDSTTPAYFSVKALFKFYFCT